MAADRIVTIATKTHRRYGTEAIDVAYQHAEIALLDGEKHSAETWFDVAAAIKRLTEQQGSACAAASYCASVRRRASKAPRPLAPRR